MSFYGNITNTSRTHFQFDRVYANREEMESKKRTDGVYAGRFVLIEYDDKIHADSILRVNKRVINDDTFYLYNMTDGDSSKSTLLTKGSINKDELVYSSDLETVPEYGYYAKNCVFYKCTSDYVAGSSEPATFVEIDEGAAEENYIINYNIDKNKYGRGYDSTVWLKVYLNGEEKYLMIAELNTVVPVFALLADAPTLTPIVPHFDLESSDIYYKLHYLPSWGMRVKSANIESGPEFLEGKEIPDTKIPYSNYEEGVTVKSDETVTWTRNEYDPETGILTKLYWYPKDGTWSAIEPTAEEDKVAGAIYYNRAGFAPEKISLDNDNDYIKVEPTGISGNQYSNHDIVGELESYPDIQEVSIMLPSIGTSIAEMWNVVYGNEQQNGGLDRNLDIAWDSTNGLRMVQENPDSHGFSYQPDQVNTLAGAINSVHDLMGMIVVDASDKVMDETFASTADDDKIYYSEGKYYRKAVHYEYENHINGEDENNVIPEDAGYKEVTSFEAFPANKYYYGTKDKVYKLETNDYPTYGRTYFTTSDPDNIPLFTLIENMSIYDKDIYYRLDNLNYINEDETPILGETYYLINAELIVGKPYIPNKYYIYNTKDEEGNILKGQEIPVDITADELLANINLCTESTFNSAYIYYKIGIYSEGEITFNIIRLYEPDYNSHYYLDSTNYILLKNNSSVLELDDIELYQITPTNKTQHFYVPGRYYTLNETSNEFSIYEEEEPDLSLDFYLKTDDVEVDLKGKYYVSNTYYYLLENRKYIIDEGLLPTDGRTYYVKSITLYVSRDVKELFGIGAEWNINIQTVPVGVTVSTRVVVPVMRELNGFARTLNTIHGLILKINQMLLVNDTRTRDLTTVLGTINVLNDIINKFELIAPGLVLIVDDYGRVHSTPYSTAQAFTAHNYGNNTDIEEAVSEDRWIKMEIDTNVIEPKITIEHNFTPVDNTITASSHNDADSSGEIKLYTPIIDTVGHTVGNNIETVELPHNYKTVTVNNTALVADNHIANLNINNEDRWIVLTPDENSDTFTIGHAAAGGETTTSYNTNDTPNFGATFNVPTITKDIKGHITEIALHTVMIPAPSLTNGAGNVVTGLTLDSAIGAFTETKANIGTLNITGYSTSGLSAETLVETDTLNLALAKLQLQIDTEITNRTNAINQEVIDRNTAITNAVNTEIADREAEIARLEALITDLTERITTLESNTTT